MLHPCHIYLFQHHHRAMHVTWGSWPMIVNILQVIFQHLNIKKIQYGEAKMTIFTTLVKDVKFASTSFLQYMEANLTTFTYVLKIVIFASPYCRFLGAGSHNIYISGLSKERHGLNQIPWSQAVMQSEVFANVIIFLFRWKICSLKML